VALNTPIPQIELALEGKVDFLKKTSPWGPAEAEAPEPQNVAQGLAALLRSKASEPQP